MRSNLANLVDDAFYAGSATASDGKWLAVSFRAMGKPGLGVAVSHHGCHMFDVWISNVGHYHAHWVAPVNPGYGSRSDRCGVRRITEGAGVSTGYRELFDGAVAS